MNSRRAPAANPLELNADLLATAARTLLEQLPIVSPHAIARLTNAVNAYDCARNGTVWHEPDDCAGSGCKYWGNCNHGNGGADCFVPATQRSEGLRQTS